MTCRSLGFKLFWIRNACGRSFAALVVVSDLQLTLATHSHPRELGRALSIGNQPTSFRRRISASTRSPSPSSMTRAKPMRGTLTPDSSN
jgi:hypothetical protein